MPLQDKRLREWASRLDQWLMESALPLWWERGADPKGGYHELLALDGSVPESFRRARVQSRQSYTYALAGTMGWQGPWREASQHGLDYLIKHYATDTPEFCTLVSSEGEVLDRSTLLYDQAFALLAAASICKAMPERTDLKAMAHRLVDHIRKTRAHPAGGFVESSENRFISNPQMHFFEAMLAWCEVEPGGVWETIADKIADLCLTKFIDKEGGFLREYFDETWRPAPGGKGHVVEPGHQFEWTWLLERYARMRGDKRAHNAALRLFEMGLRGIDPARDAAVHACNDSFAVTVPTARLWAQTERIKAALILAPFGGERMIDEAVKGAATLWRYLETPLPGLWRDKLESDNCFVEEPAPASSFYHIIICVESLKEAAV